MIHDTDIERTPYNVVFRHFLGGISDPDFALYTDDILEEQMVQLLNAAIPRFTYPKKNIRDKNDIKQVFNVELDVDEIAILAKLMTIEWLSKRIHDAEMMENPMTVTDFTSPNQGSMMRAMVVALTDARREVAEMIMAYGRRSDDFGQSRFTELGGAKR